MGAVPEIDLTVYQYADQQAKLQFLGSADTTIDLSGLTFTAGIAMRPGLAAVATITVDHTDSAAGILSLVLPHSEAAKCTSAGMCWTLYATDAVGNVAPFCLGMVQVVQGVKL